MEVGRIERVLAGVDASVGGHRALQWAAASAVRSFGPCRTLGPMFAAGARGGVDAAHPAEVDVPARATCDATEVRHLSVAHRLHDILAAPQASHDASRRPLRAVSRHRPHLLQSGGPVLHPWYVRFPEAEDAGRRFSDVERRSEPRAPIGTSRVRRVSGPALHEGPSVLAGFAQGRSTRVAPHRHVRRAIGGCRISGKEIFHPFSYQSRKQQLTGHLDHLLPRQ